MFQRVALRLAPVLVIALAVLLAGEAAAEDFLASTDGMSASNNAAISANGHALTTDTLANFATRGDLASFDVIFVSPSLDTVYATLQTLVAPGGALEQYVAAGGLLVLNVAGNAGNQNDIAPGGVDYDATITGDLVTFVTPAHPYLTGAGFLGVPLAESPDFELPGWNNTHHGHLLNLVPGSTVVINSDPQAEPGWVEYPHGLGKVILTTFTYGWGSNGAVGAPQANLINYAAWCATPLEVICPADQVVECTGPAGTPHTVNVDVENRDGEAMTVTFDVDGINVQTVIVPAGTAPTNTTIAFTHTYVGLGAHTVDVTALDSSGDSETCSFTVTIQDTTPPVITLVGPATLTLECGVDAYTEEGATASDVCDASVSVVIGGDTVDTTVPGTYVVTYDASDDSGNAATQVTRTVTVQDTLPPVITCATVKDLLWMPRNGLSPIGFTASAEDACEGTVGFYVDVYSDEGHGSAPYAPDATGTDAASLRLRAERAYPGGNGRWYLIVITARDSVGNQAVACKSVVVPIMPTTASIAAVRAEAAAAALLCPPEGDPLPSGWSLLLSFTIGTPPSQAN